MQLSSNALQIATNFIADQEDFEPDAYWDTNGYAIGYGNHYYANGSAVQEGDTISQGDALTLLQFYVQQFYNTQVAPKISASLNDNQVAALISLSYNCGSVPGALASLINSGASEDAINAEWQSVCITAGGIPSNALWNRRGDELGLFDTILYNIQQNPGTSIAIAVAGLGVIVVAAFYFIRVSKAKAA